MSGEQPVAPVSLIGRVIGGKLELQQLLGTGSMGQVYRAHHHGLDKPVAIKVMRPEMRPTERQVARFRAEAQNSSRLDHQNSVRILDFGEDGDDKLLYIAMEFLDGEELSKVLAREAVLPPDRACWIMLQVLAALAAAHDEGVVHRDVKPSNIMLIRKLGDDGWIDDFVKVCDFGIAKLLVGDKDVKPLTLEGVALGTPAFSSPEQVMGLSIDGRSDIYSAAVILYTMLAGRRPFVASTPMEVAMMQVEAVPPLLAGLRPDLDPSLLYAVEVGMSKKPEQRFPDARTFRNELKPFINSAVTTPPTLAPRPDSMPPQRSVSAPGVSRLHNNRPARRPSSFVPVAPPPAESRPSSPRRVPTAVPGSEDAGLLEPPPVAGVGTHARAPTVPDLNRHDTDEIISDFLSGASSDE